MIETTIAPSGQESTTEPQPAYVLRGLGLFEFHRDELLKGYQGGGRWLIPSGTDGAKVYEVRISIRRQSCECIGFGQHKHCSHIIAAQRAARRSAICDACGERRWRWQLVKVGPDNLTFFEGDLLCRECARSHGAA